MNIRRREERLRRAISGDRARPRHSRSAVCLGLFLAALCAGPAFLHASPAPTAAATFAKDVKPLLNKFCYDCHADGADKGNVAFDAFPSEDALLRDNALWLKVLKNVRAGMMPPAK